MGQARTDDRSEPAGAFQLSEHLLHPDDVERGALFDGDLAEAADFDEAVLDVAIEQIQHGRAVPRRDGE